LMLGLSAQDTNIQEIFVKAQVHLPATFLTHPPAVVSEDRVGVDQRSLLRRFRGEARQKDCGWSSGEPELMEDAFHCRSNGMVVGSIGFGWCAPRVGRGGRAAARSGLIALFRRTRSAVIALKPVGSGS